MFKGLFGTKKAERSSMEMDAKREYENQMMVLKDLMNGTINDILDFSELRTEEFVIKGTKLA